MAVKTIQIVGDSDRQYEHIIGGTITPGMLVELSAADTVQAHSTAAGAAEKLFALEYSPEGKEIDTDYTTSLTHPCIVLAAQPGDEIYAWLADGETATVGSFLESDGNGKLQVYAAASADTATSNIVAVATEAVDMSDSSGADPSGRIIVRVV
jgi:hypothetical protein